MYHAEFDETALPSITIMPPRHLPLTVKERLKERLKDELACLEKANVIKREE